MGNGHNQYTQDSRYGTTDVQKRALEFIRSYINYHHIPPSFEEIRIHLGVKSKSGVSRVVHALQDRGIIRFQTGISRTIEIIDRYCPHCGGNLHEKNAGIISDPSGKEPKTAVG